MTLILETHYRSKEKCDQKPEIFSTGSYTIKDKQGAKITFDFLETEYSVELKEGYVYIQSVQQYLDKDAFDSKSGLTEEELIEVARNMDASDIVEFYREAFLDDSEEQVLELDMQSFGLCTHRGDLKDFNEEELKNH